MVKANMTSQEFWSWWGSTSSKTELRSKEPVLNMPGEIKKGGGSKVKGRKKKKPNNLPSERYLLF